MAIPMMRISTTMKISRTRRMLPKISATRLRVDTGVAASVDAGRVGYSLSFLHSGELVTPIVPSAYAAIRSCVASA